MCESAEETAPGVTCERLGLGFCVRERRDRLLSDLFSSVGTPRVMKADRCRLSPGPQRCDNTLRTRMSLCLQENTRLASPGRRGAPGVSTVSRLCQYSCSERTTESCCFGLPSARSGRGHQQMTELRKRLLSGEEDELRSSTRAYKNRWHHREVCANC